MGHNVLKQLSIPVPDFFSGKYIAMRMVERPDEQYKKIPVTPLQPMILESKHEKYPPGLCIGIDNVDDFLAESIRDGFNVSFSPYEIRGAITYGPRLFAREPCDSLVVAETRPERVHDKGYGFVFYLHRAHLLRGRNIGYTSLPEKDFAEGVSRCNIHFAFVPAKSKRRPVVSIKRFKDKPEIISWD